jgi:tetratricopeptide (TPR) repeat protein
VNSALTEIPARFQQALAVHQIGRLAEAQSMYEDILKIHPEHSDALHLLGLIAAQTNNMQRAKGLIGRAIDINPNNAAFQARLC